MEGASRLLRFVAGRRPTRHRFDADTDARRTTVRGDLETVDRMELKIRDADAEWPAGFAARLLFWHPERKRSVPTDGVGDVGRPRRHLLRHTNQPMLLRLGAAPILARMGQVEWLGRRAERTLRRLANELAKADISERRLLLIRPDDPSERKSSTVDWKQIGIAAFGVTGFLLNKLLSRSRRPPVGTLLLPPVIASKLFQFPPGHPVLDHAYAAHPIVTDQYLPVASFHPKLFEQRVSELMTLFAALGSHQTRITCREGSFSAGGIRLESTVLKAPGAATAESRTGSERLAHFEETYRPTGIPAIPSDLVWFPHEDSWKQLARRRLEFGAKSISVMLEHREEFGVNASVLLGFEKLGVKLGGAYAKFETTRWEFDGRFE